MANRIISFQQDPIQKRLQENPYEVFLDISMDSTEKDDCISVTHIIPAIFQPNYVTLKEDNINDDDIELMLDVDDPDQICRILAYINESDYDQYVLDDDSIEKYYSLLGTDPYGSDLSNVITDPDDDSSMYIGILSSNEYSSENKVKVEYIHNYTYVLNKLVNVNAIKNSLNNIFTWIPGERVLLPEFGTNLRKLLYEGITDYNVEQIVAEIKHVVSQWEPRVQVTNVVDVSTTDDHENNTVHLKVIYTIQGLSDAQFEYEYVQPINSN